MQNNHVVTYTPVPDTRRALELIMRSKYIRLITPNGVRRISRREAVNAINDTTRCADCIGGVSWCEACRYIDNPLTVRGVRIYLVGTLHGAIIQP
jgi:hypothetical protein